MRRPRLTRRLLRGLTPKQRRILYMRIERSMSFRAIQLELGYKSVATVHQHYRYALAKARAKYAGKVPT